jgi:serine/threonine protein kinase
VGADTLAIAGYEVLHRLGGGGMGEVFLVRHPRLPRNDALKLLAPALSVNSEFCQRFEREADLLAPLRHPNIITLYDRGNHDGRLWLAMEHIPGSDAAELTKAGALSADEVIDIITRVGDALDYAYREHGVTHRDVKPANILVEIGQDQCTKSVKLVDFGIAKAAGETTSLTATGIAIGTVSYIAPEALEGISTDNRADIYSLACTAFQMLTRTLPYPQRSVPALIAAHLTGPTPAITEFAPHLPEHFNDVFTRALAKNPAERFLTCREFTGALVGPQPPGLVPDTRAWIKSVVDSRDTPASANSATTQAAPTINAIRAPKPHASKARSAAPSSNRRLNRTRRIATLIAIALGVVLAGGIGLIGLIAVDQNKDHRTEASSKSPAVPPPLPSATTTPAGTPGTPAFIVALSTDYTVGAMTECSNGRAAWRQDVEWWCRGVPPTCAGPDAVPWPGVQ